MQPTHDLRRWQHDHDFGTTAERQAEQRTLWVVGLTVLTMVAELAVGWLTGSMALLADGWHMASHAGALGLAAFAYHYAHRHAGNPRFTFGTGKVSALAGYTSALFLVAVAAWMAWESVGRLRAPIAIQYAEALVAAVLGLVVNLASAWLLGHKHRHADDHDHDHDPEGEHGLDPQRDHADHNLRAAYLHVITDALTSVLAIAALAGGWLYGWGFLDPLMGIVGAVLVGRWAWSLAGDSAHVLLDAEDHRATAAAIRAAIATLPDHEVADLHVWRVGTASRACIVSLVTHAPLGIEAYHALLAPIPGLDHVTVEVHRCDEAGCQPPATATHPPG